jgi:hypothetical protein
VLRRCSRGIPGALSTSSPGVSQGPDGRFASTAIAAALAAVEWIVRGHARIPPHRSRRRIGRPRRRTARTASPASRSSWRSPAWNRFTVGPRHRFLAVLPFARRPDPDAYLGDEA